MSKKQRPPKLNDEQLKALVEAVREVFSNEGATDSNRRIAPKGDPSMVSKPKSMSIHSVSIDGARQNCAGCFLNKKQIAEWLGVTVRTLDEYMHRGLIPYYKLGRTVRFRQQDLEEHLKSTCRVAGRSSQ